MNVFEFDITELKAYNAKLAALAGGDISKFLTAETNKIGKMMLSDVKKLTPVGKYPPSSGKKGGTLRKGWRSKKLDKHTVKIFNSTEYALYVEYGHRTRSGGWVDGRRMLGRAEYNLMYGENNINNILNADLEKFFNDLLGS